MSVVTVDPIMGRSSSINEKFERAYSRKYLVTSNDYGDDEYYIRTHCGFSLYSAHPDDAAARLKNIAVSENSRLNYVDAGGVTRHGALWDLTLEYGVINPIDNTADGAPTSQPLEVSIDGVTYEAIVEQDISNNPIVNTAGDKYSPAPKRDQTRCTIKVKQNFLTLGSGSFQVATLLGYSNSVNNATWFGFPAKSVKFEPPNIVPVYSQFSDVIYFRVELTFNYVPETWQLVIANNGYKELYTVSGTTKQRPILVDGQYASDTCFLDSSGHYIPPPVNSGDVVYSTFDIYPAIDFTTIFAFPVGLFGT